MVYLPGVLPRAEYRIRFVQRRAIGIPPFFPIHALGILPRAADN